jgi:hypothetical protein
MDESQRAQGKGGSALDRLSLVLMPAFIAVVGGLAAREFLLAPFRAWNDTRLAPSAALLGGSGFYFGPGEGPLLGHIYSPIAPFFYLPAVMTPSPEVAVMLGTLLTSLAFFGPVLLLLFLEGRGRARWVWVCFLVFCLFTFYERALLGPAFWIHADAPALGFGAIACAALYGSDVRPAWGRLLVSAFAVVLAAGAKQVALPLVAALPLYLLLRDGRGVAGRYLASLALAGAAVLGFVLLWVDFEAMWFTAVTVPMSHPWKATDPLAGLGTSLLALGRVCLPMTAALAGLWLLVRRTGSSLRRDGARNPLRSNPWFLLLFVAFFFVPTSVLGYVKVGGDVNTLAYTAYFATAAGLLLSLQVVGLVEPGEGDRRGSAARAAVLVAGGVLAVSVLPTLTDLRKLYDEFDENPERRAWEFVTAQPRTIYFPFHPLMGLMAEGTAYHTTSGLISQDLTGDEVEVAHLEAYLPRGMGFVAFRGQADYSQKYFPEYDRRVRVPALPGWTVLAPGRSKSSGPVGGD